jgi:phosphopantetheinyl transferase
MGLDRWIPVRALDGCWEPRRSAERALVQAIEQRKLNLDTIQRFELQHAHQPLAEALQAQRGAIG